MGKTKLTGTRSCTMWLLVIIAVSMVGLLGVGGGWVYLQDQQQKVTLGATSTAQAMAFAATADVEARNWAATQTPAAAATATVQTLAEIEDHYQKGIAYIDAKMWIEASKELRKVLEKDPNFREVQTKLLQVETQLREMGIPTETSSSLPTTMLSPVPIPAENISTPIPQLINREHKLGEPWEHDNVSLNLVNIDIRAGDGEAAAIHAWFSFFNKTGQRILVEWDFNDLYVEDSHGNVYVDWEGSATDSTWIDPAARYDFDRYYTTSPGQRSRIAAGSEFVVVVVDNFSRINNARWIIDINPLLEPISTPPTDSVKQLAEAWHGNRIKLALKDIDIRAGDGESAAVHAWFEVTNIESQRILLDLDYAYIFVEDSFGNRFIDWDGGGVNSVWLEPSEAYEFDRYYAIGRKQRSRIASGSEFVLVTVRKLMDIENARWRIDIIR